MNDLNKKLIHISVPILIIHFLEELYFSFYNIDDSIYLISKYFGWDTLTFFLLIQLILFIFLAILLVLITLRKNINFGGLILSLILIYEFSHIIQAFTLKFYYPGFISGSILFIIGILYWNKVIKNFSKASIA